jgi:hypothetical protein
MTLKHYLFQKLKLIGMNGFNILTLPLTPRLQFILNKFSIL